MTEYKIGDKVLYQGKECEIESFDNDGYVNVKYIDVDYDLAHEADLTPVVAKNATTHTSLSPLGIEPKEMDFERQKLAVYGYNTKELFQFIEWLKLQINQFSQSGNMVDAVFWRNKYENAECELEKLNAENEDLKASNQELLKEINNYNSDHYKIHKFKQALKEFLE